MKKVLKWVVGIVVVIIVLFIVSAAISGIKDSGNDEVASTTESSSKTVETKESEPTIETTEEESTDKVVEFSESDEFSFTDSTIIPQKATISKEDGKSYLTLEFFWRNDSFKKAVPFNAAAAIDAFQGEGKLTDIDNQVGNPDSPFYYPNAVGGELSEKVVYELNDDETPAEFTFVPMDAYSDSHKIVIDVK